MKQNYQLMLDKTLEALVRDGKRPRLLLHACCAPCSSYVLEYLADVFDITLFFYNPNISPKDEYERRARELIRLGEDMGLAKNVSFLKSDYDPQRFYELTRGLEDLPEGGERCKICYTMRLQATAKAAAEGGFDLFTTTLSISPHKNAELLCTIGGELSEKYGVEYLYSDFKKRNGYKRSCELSEKYGLYRQDFCGCIFSKLERDKKDNEKKVLL